MDKSYKELYDMDHNKLVAFADTMQQDRISWMMRVNPLIEERDRLQKELEHMTKERNRYQGRASTLSTEKDNERKAKLLYKINSTLQKYQNITNLCTVIAVALIALLGSYIS